MESNKLHDYCNGPNRRPDTLPPEMRGERSDTRCGCKSAQCHRSRLICVLLAQIFHQVMDQSPGNQRPDGQTALYPKHDPSGVGSCRGLSLMAADVFGHPRYNYGFRYISLPFLCVSLSLSFFLLFLISVFPSRPEAKVPPMALGWPLLSLLPCPFANPMNASHRRPPMLRRRSDATKYASHLHDVPGSIFVAASASYAVLRSVQLTWSGPGI